MCPARRPNNPTLSSQTKAGKAVAAVAADKAKGAKCGAANGRAANAAGGDGANAKTKRLEKQAVDLKAKVKRDGVRRGIGHRNVRSPIQAGAREGVGGSGS